MHKLQTKKRRQSALLKAARAMFLSCLALAAGLTINAGAQQPLPQAPSPQGGNPAPTNPASDPFYAPTPHPNETKFLQHLADDQKDIFTSPFHIKPR